MKLLRLSAQNFKKHEALDITFGDGLTVIRGPNWAGKSTVLHAVLFALFGPAAVPDKKDRLPRRGGGKPFVALQFEGDDGQVYSVERSMTAATVLLVGSGHRPERSGDRPSKLASGATAVDQWMTEHLGVDRRQALQIAYSPQSETAALLTLGVPALNRLVESLSGADVIEQMIDKAGGKVRAYEGQVVPVHPVDNGPAIQRAQDEIQELTATRAAALEKIQSHEADIASLKTELDEAQALRLEVAKAREAAARHAILTEHLADAQAEADCLVQELDALPAREGLEQRQDWLVSRDRELRAALAEAKAADRAREGLQRWFETTGAKWQEQEKNLPRQAELAQELDRLGSVREECRDRVVKAQASRDAVRELVEGAICPTCERPFEDHDPEALKAELQIREDAYTAAIDEFREVSAQINRLIDEIDTLDLPPADYEARYQEKLDDLAELTGHSVLTVQADQIAEVEQELAEIKDTLNQVRDADQALAAARKRVEDLNQELGRTDPKDRAERPDLPDESELKAKVEDVKVRLAYSEGQLDQCRGDLAQADARLRLVVNEMNRLNDEQQAHDEAVARVQEAERNLVLWKRFQDWLRKSKGQLLADLWDAILAEAGVFLAQATGGHATALLRSEDGEFAILEANEDDPVSAASVSGGMRALAATALRLALADLVPTAPRWVLLDEPSSELNDENAANLAAALQGYDRQVVLVTHRTGEEYLADELVTL